MNVLFVEENAAPYRDYTLLEMQRNTGVNLLMYTRPASYDNHKEWEYQSPLDEKRKYAKSETKTKLGSYRHGYTQVLKEFKPDIVITGSPLEGFIAKKIYKSRIVLRSDTMKPGRNADKRWNKVILRKMYNVADAYWVPGNAAEKYYSNYLYKRVIITQGAYTYDAVEQNKKISEMRHHRDEFRANWNIKNSDFLFLFVGKLINTRHISDLLDAVEDMNNVNIKFIIIGDGPDDAIVKQFSKSDNRIIHIPSVKLDDLESFYAMADAYIHPGEEPYSLALYEAAVAGIPIVASEKVGATFDCLENNKNGLLFTFGSKESLAECIDSVSKGKITKENCLEMKRFVLEQRGVPWAAKELKRACGL